MTYREVIRTFYLGTAVHITQTLSIATATTATITIVDPSNVTKVSSVSMTKDADYVYSYIYQSTSTDTAGEYIVTFTITYGGYTSIFQDKFKLVEQE